MRRQARPHMAVVANGFARRVGVELAGPECCLIPAGGTRNGSVCGIATWMASFRELLPFLVGAVHGRRGVAVMAIQVMASRTVPSEDRTLLKIRDLRFRHRLFGTVHR